MANGGKHLDHFLSKYMLDACFFLKVFFKKVFLNKATFPVIVVNILHYIQRSFSVRVQPARTMIVTMIDLLRYQNYFVIQRYQDVFKDMIEVYQ